MKGITESKQRSKSVVQKDIKVKNLTMAGIMAALTTLMTAYICHVPVGINGGYIHFGDAMIYLAAVLLPKPYALAAAAIGGGLADLMTAPMWAPATIIIKMLIVLPFTSHIGKIIRPRNIIALVAGYLISGLGYFVAEYIIFGTWAAFFISMGQTFMQSAGSAVVFLLLGTAFDKANVKTRFFER